MELLDTILKFRKQINDDIFFILTKKLQEKPDKDVNNITNIYVKEMVDSMPRRKRKN